MTTHKEQVLKFWNQRAQYHQNAGTNDFMLKHLEEAVLLERIPRCVEVLDIGCGNASTLIQLIKQKECTGVGVDYADNLLNLAEQLAMYNNVQAKLKLIKRDVRQLGDDLGHFNYITTQRCLINLETEEEQKDVFHSICQLLKPGGYYYMIEAFNDGNRTLNKMRDIFHLEPITPPWHNKFFELNDVLSWTNLYPVNVREVSHFASTYYFLSRVIYAKLASDHGEALRYDSEINQISMALPAIGEFGATKLVVWQKTE